MNPRQPEIKQIPPAQWTEDLYGDKFPGGKEATANPEDIYGDGKKPAKNTPSNQVHSARPATKQRPFLCGLMPKPDEHYPADVAQALKELRTPETMGFVAHVVQSGVAGTDFALPEGDEPLRVTWRVDTAAKNATGKAKVSAEEARDFLKLTATLMKLGMEGHGMREIAMTGTSYTAEFTGDAAEIMRVALTTCPAESRSPQGRGI